MEKLHFPGTLAFFKHLWNALCGNAFELTAYSFLPPQPWNISFLQRFDIWEKPEVFLDAGLEGGEGSHTAL